MRQVTLAKSAGFCFGVKRAVNKVYEEAKKGRVYTYGPIIHNEEVVKDLENKGVKVINSLEEFQDIPEGTVVIRSHGVAKEVYDFLKKQDLKIVDATCPFVLKIHRIVEEHAKAGEHIVIIGNDKHPEVEGIKGWCGPKNRTVIQNREEAENFAIDGKQKVCIVSQTTFNYNKFQLLVEIISKKGYDIRCLNTICNATEICKMECENTYYIQTLDDLDLTKLKSIDNVGITAGASTPNNIIEEVQKNVRNEF